MERKSDLRNRFGFFVGGESATKRAGSAVGNRTRDLKKSFNHFQPADLSARYAFIRSVTGEFSIATLWKLLAVSRTAYYRYLRGETYQPTETKKEQLEAVNEIFWQHKRRYSQRRMLVELREQGYTIGRYRERSLIQQQNLVAIQPIRT